MELLPRRGPRLAALIATASLITTAAAAGLLPTAAAAAPGRPDQVTALQADADAVVAAGLPGYAAQVTYGRRVSYVQAGLADRRTGRPLTPADAFDIASNTKTFGATVVLQLVGQHRLSLTDTLATLLPGAVPNGSAITLRMLLNHTSGLFDYTEDEQWLAALRTDPDHAWTQAELLARALAHPPNFAPGTQRLYSNTGYLLVGMILERTTGQSARDLFARRIIRPLGLRHTYYAAGSRFTAARHARGYRIGTDAGRLTYTDVTDVGLLSTGMDGGLVSTTADLTRFFQALLGGHLLRPAELAEMKRTIPVQGDPSRSYGLGLARAETPCGTTWGNDGASIGYLSTASFSEDGSRGLVSIINGNVDPAADPAVIEQTLLPPAVALLDQQACTLYGKPVPAGS
ncbi:MAG TPA: serine hydrolase domain-containing protein [Mycobacteriales bacterium]|nr:serine hydrolase domain-containing protein [Mycobacteriales bacterium]